MLDLDPLKRLPDDRRSVVAPPNNIPYVLAVIVMMVLGVAGIVAVTVVRPEADNTALIAAIIGFLAPTTLSLLAFMKSQETHLSVNSRLDGFMRHAESAARMQGLHDGRAQGRTDANVRTDELSDRDARHGGERPARRAEPSLATVQTTVEETKEIAVEIKEQTQELAADKKKAG